MRTTMIDDLDLLTQIMVVVCVASFVGLCLLVMGGGSDAS